MPDWGNATTEETLNCEVQCDSCDEFFPQDEIRNANGENLCDSCFSEDYFVCSRCGLATGLDEQESHGGESFCEECFDDNFTHCTACGDVVANDDVISVAGEALCDGCFDERYTTCDACGTSVLRDYVCSYDCDVFCEDCWHDSFMNCPDCGDDYPNDDMRWSGVRDEYLCSCCFGSSDHNGIHDYTFKPNPIFYHAHGKENFSIRRMPQALYFGVETEIELPYTGDAGSAAESIADEFFYCKHDSSLSHGFEIVTMPFTWEYMTKNRQRFLNMFGLRNEGARSYNTSTCGMHVHMSRSAFSHLQLLKFIVMFYDYPDFTFRVSRRTRSHFDCYARCEKPDNVVEIARHNRATWSGGRGALNFSNSHTIECRIFRGTLNPYGWFANMEYLKSLFDFCTGHGLRDINPVNYLSWMEDHQQEFPNFYKVHMPRLKSESAEEGAA